MSWSDAGVGSRADRERRRGRGWRAPPPSTLARSPCGGEGAGPGSGSGREPRRWPATGGCVGEARAGGRWWCRPVAVRDGAGGRRRTQAERPGAAGGGDGGGVGAGGGGGGAAVAAEGAEVAGGAGAVAGRWRWRRRGGGGGGGGGGALGDWRGCRGRGRRGVERRCLGTGWRCRRSGWSPAVEFALGERLGPPAPRARLGAGGQAGRGAGEASSGGRRSVRAAVGPFPAVGPVPGGGMGLSALAVRLSLCGQWPSIEGRWACRR